MSDELEQVDKVISALYERATESEARMLDELRLRAGQIWKCEHCSWFNTPNNQVTCEQCGAPKFHSDYIHPGRKDEGEEGYWVVSIPTMIWSIEEVRTLAAIIPNADIQYELLVAIGDKKEEET